MRSRLFANSLRRSRLTVLPFLLSNKAPGKYFTTNWIDDQERSTTDTNVRSYNHKMVPTKFSDRPRVSEFSRMGSLSIQRETDIRIHIHLNTRAPRPHSNQCQND